MGVSGAATAIGNQLTVYSSLPLQGPSGAISEQIVNGEKLALARTGGRVGPFTGQLRLRGRLEPHERAVEPGRDRRERQDGR